MPFQALRHGTLEAAAADARHQPGCPPELVRGLFLTGLTESQHDRQARRFRVWLCRPHGVSPLRVNLK